MLFDPHIFNSVALAAEEAAAPSGVASLGINAKLFLAQLINFAVVLFILWKWVFKPVSKLLAERTERIHKSLLYAKKVDEDKANFEKWKDEQIINTRHEAGIIVGKAQTDAQKAKDEGLSQTKEAQDKLVEQAKKQIEDEKRIALQSAKNELADLVTNATEKVLRQKLDGKKDEELIRETLKQLT